MQVETRAVQNEPTVARVLAIAGLKGGVGRTTTAVNLAALLALSERRILLVDLDPTGSATNALAVPCTEAADPYAAFSEPIAFREWIRSIDRIPGLELWAGGPMLTAVEGRLWNRAEGRRDHVLETCLDAARQVFDLIIVDAPPGFGPLCRNALYCADDLLLPVHGRSFSPAAFARTIDLLDTIRPAMIDDLRIYFLRVGDEPIEGLDEVDPSWRRRISVLKRRLVKEAAPVSAATAAGEVLINSAPRARVTRSYVEVCRELMVPLFNRLPINQSAELAVQEGLNALLDSQKKTGLLLRPNADQESVEFGRSGE